MTTETESSGQEEIDIYLLPTHAWTFWNEGIHEILTADKIHIESWKNLPDIPFCRFRTRYENRQAFAFLIQAKRIDFTAITTQLILEYFSTLANDGKCNYRIDRIILIGFCGTLKGDEFKIGDVGIASQIDCYMEKAKLSDNPKSETQKTGNDQRVEFSGEVYRPTLEFVRLAQNMMYLDPKGFEDFRQNCLRVRRDQNFDSNILEFMRQDTIGIHTPHLASATLLSTTATAVGWVKARDRKLLMLDMESGGMMAAIWMHNQRRSTNQIKTIVIRAAADFCDETREKIQPIRKHSQKCAFQNACYFMAWMLKFKSESLANLSKPEKVEVGILVPLEEEFGYFSEQLPVSLNPHYDSNEDRFLYSFELGKKQCACQFIGDMGLVQTALATNTFLNTCPNLQLLILIGVGGSLSEDIKVCDVAVAKTVDPYLEDTSITNIGESPLRLYTADEDLIKIIQSVFEEKRNEIQVNFRNIYNIIKKIPDEIKDSVLDHDDIVTLHCVAFASSDAVAAGKSWHPVLAARGNSVVEMKSAGMHVAVETRNSLKSDKIRTLFFRGISDNASCDKGALDAVEPIGILRKVAMRNTASIVIHLLESDEL
ncbi:hypothetical protein CCAX7_32760 [Capsulimonas corticalis]|uniref:Uncharacterized protein n=1 Tax=Capsulimonas corticalis TaxID=2219043 RepID=A0A402D796_9BACT|nr:hypothetical protein [Capsulimonas corticalis]BDI31225.1 hypothetical protein CCAX7_32760 [Capsulimonas corticalis]